MKRVMLGAAATAVAAVAAILVPQAAGATGSTGGSSTEIYINDKVDYDAAGAVLDLGGLAKCTGAANQGFASATVSQAPPETPSPVSFSTGGNVFVCDGQWHSFALSVFGGGYDAGRAKATVTLTPVAGSPAKTVTKCVTIVNV